MVGASTLLAKATCMHRIDEMAQEKVKARADLKMSFNFECATLPHIQTHEQNTNAFLTKSV